MIIAKVVSVVMLISGAILIYRRSQDHALHRFFWPALLYKMFLTVFFGWLYISYYGYGDTNDFYELSLDWIDLFSEDKSAFIDSYFRDKPDTLYFQQMIEERPRLWFFSKCLFPFVLVAGGDYWLASAVLSFLTFFSLWKLSELIHKKFSLPVFTSLFSFFILPSFVFGSSGLSKESISIILIVFIIYNTISFFDSSGIKTIFRCLMIILSLLLLWYIKFYYAVGIFMITALFILRELYLRYFSTKSKMIRIGVFVFSGAVIVSSLFLFSVNNYYLNFSNFASAIHMNYEATRYSPDGISNFELPGFQPSLMSLATWFFPAAVYGLFGPYLWNIHNLFSAFAAIENLLLIFLVASGLYLLIQKKITLNYWGGLIILYSLVLAGFLTMASPNWGTLLRYKVAFLPFLYLLLLSRHPLSSKLEKFIDKRNSR